MPGDFIIILFFDPGIVFQHHLDTMTKPGDDRLPFLGNKSFVRRDDFDNSAGLDDHVKSFVLGEFDDIRVGGGCGDCSDELPSISIATPVEVLKLLSEWKQQLENETKKRRRNRIALLLLYNLVYYAVITIAALISLTPK